MKYKTKARQINKKKNFTLLIAVLVGVVAIAGAYLGAVTPTMAENYEIGSFTHIEEEVALELSIEEHVWNILTDEYNLSLSEKVTAMRIIDCESKFDPMAIGDSGDSLGLWQIHEPSHGDKDNYSRECSFDVYCSTRFAMEIYQEAGWYPWSCY